MLHARLQIVKGRDWFTQLCPMLYRLFKCYLIVVSVSQNEGPNEDSPRHDHVLSGVDDFVRMRIGISVIEPEGEK